MTATTDTIDVRARLDEAPMSATQIVVVCLAFVLSALDGYDVLSVTFAAPAISKSWEIGKDALGIVLSSGLGGMALGSLFLAPLGDVVGRRPLVLTCLVLMGLGMLMCYTATSLVELSAWRVVTGIGIGACVATIVSIASEFANARRRAFVLAAVAMGYPVGGLLGGLLAAALLTAYGWPAIFMAGFVLAVVMLPLVAFLLPESPSFLVSRQGPKALPRLNALLARLGREQLTVMPVVRKKTSSGYRGVFAPTQILTTLRVTAVNFLFAFATYYVLSWLPQLVADAGFEPAIASLASSSASMAGVVGGLLVGAMAGIVGLKRLTVTVMVGLGVAMVGFGFAPPLLPVLMSAAAACGFFLFGGAAGIYGIVARSFDEAARSSGSGFVLGIGRFASASAPLLAGWLFASGLTRAEVTTAFAVCSIIAGVLLLIGRGDVRQERLQRA